MSIRGYKNIYEQFARMFPELNKMTDGWKGVMFRSRHIAITMKNGSVIHFKFYGLDNWELYQVPTTEGSV